MWPVKDESETVTCIGCGDQLEREDAREYDKYGNRWERRGKEFEHFCKPCHTRLCHHDRNGLEELLVEIETDGLDQRSFTERYFLAVEERYGPLEER